MAVSDVQVDATAGMMWVTARGGTRRQRGSAIGAVVRGRTVERIHIRYSETYGFQTATYITYRVL